MLSPDNLTFAQEYGLAGVLALVFGAGIWKLVWYIINNTIPKTMYEERRKEEIGDLAEAVDRNTVTLDKMCTLLKERIPRRGE